MLEYKQGSCQYGWGFCVRGGAPKVHLGRLGAKTALPGQPRR
jgi:hypothetical protein